MLDYRIYFFQNSQIVQLVSFAIIGGLDEKRRAVEKDSWDCAAISTGGVTSASRLS